MMPSVNYVMHGGSFARTIPEVSLYKSLILEEKYCCSYTRKGDRWEFLKADWKPNLVYL